MAFQTSSGATLSMSSTLPATYDPTGYGALTKVLIGEITNIGEFGKQFSKVTHEPLASRGSKKGKGTYDNGTLSPQLALDDADAGQAAMSTALESDDPVAFCVTLKNGDEYWFEALVMAFKAGVGGGNDVVTRKPELEITDNPFVKIAA